MFIFLVDGYLSQSTRVQTLRSVVHGVGDIPIIVCPNKPAELFAVRFGELVPPRHLLRLLHIIAIPTDMHNAISRSRHGI